MLKKEQEETIYSKAHHAEVLLSFMGDIEFFLESA